MKVKIHQLRHRTFVIYQAKLKAEYESLLGPIFEGAFADIEYGKAPEIKGGFRFVRFADVCLCVPVDNPEITFFHGSWAKPDHGLITVAYKSFEYLENGEGLREHFDAALLELEMASI